jgi:phosphate transport system permease protein
MDNTMQQPLDLRKRPRVREEIIRVVLFLCGLFSVGTTIAILLVLATQSLNFFTGIGFLNTEYQIADALNTTDTTIVAPREDNVLKVGYYVRLDRELMEIVAIDATTDTITVVRGVENTAPQEHAAGTNITAGKRATLSEFFGGTTWQPRIGELGIWPLISATLTTSFIAMLVAVPFGIGVAIYLSEYASARVRNVLKPILELLAGVPTVVYGFFALSFVTPLLQNLFGPVIGLYNMLSAGLVMGIMIIPTICSMSEDALSAVPRSLREGSYGLGATRLETVLSVLLPAALSGILAAIILGVSRAVGETMIVAIASGVGPNFTFDPRQAAETMTGHIARISSGDLTQNSIDYNSLFAIGLMLFVITFVLNIISNAVRQRFREVYQ